MSFNINNNGPNKPQIKTSLPASGEKGKADGAKHSLLDSLSFGLANKATPSGDAFTPSTQSLAQLAAQKDASPKEIQKRQESKAVVLGVLDKLEKEGVFKQGANEISGKYLSSGVVQGMQKFGKLHEESKGDTQFLKEFNGELNVLQELGLV